jgi:hypothetical protein
MNNQKRYLEECIKLLKSYLKIEVEGNNELKVENEKLKRENEKLKRENKKFRELTYDKDDEWLRKRYIKLIEGLWNLKKENEKLNSTNTLMFLEKTKKEILKLLDTSEKCENCENCENCEKMQDNRINTLSKKAMKFKKWKKHKVEKGGNKEQTKEPNFFEFWLENYSNKEGIEESKKQNLINFY